jgi:hypothetical protein
MRQCGGGRKLADMTEPAGSLAAPGQRCNPEEGDLRPTDEQQAIIDAVRGDRDVVVQARAGTGKTATLVMATRATPYRKTLYLAYNKAIALDARRKFGRQVECRTLHSLAYARAKPWMRDRLAMPRQNGRMVAGILNIIQPEVIPKGAFGMPIEVRLPPHHLSRLVIEGVRRFCYSADPEPQWRHVPRQPGLTAEAHEHLAEQLLPLLQRAWGDLCVPSGQLRLEHDHYLKQWARHDPQLPFDLVLLDEGQDSNRLTSALIAAQTNTQTVIVGDSAQQLYKWRGATDALDAFPGHDVLFLTQSWRFGPAIAELGNVFLRLVGSRPYVRGNPAMSSRLVGEMIAPDAILCRTNAGAMDEAIGQLELGRATFLQGGGDGIRKMAEAAIELQAWYGTNNPELCGFGSWTEVLDYVEVDPSGSDLRAFVRLVETHGAQTIIEACDKLINDDGGRGYRGEPEVPLGAVVVSTMHRSKGLEWPKVQIGRDVAAPRVDPETWSLRDPDSAEMMLNYVAATRARLELAAGALLEWKTMERATR